jgi:hypothetical protein
LRQSLAVRDGDKSRPMPARLYSPADGRGTNFRLCAESLVSECLRRQASRSCSRNSAGLVCTSQLSGAVKICARDPVHRLHGKRSLQGSPATRSRRGNYRFRHGQRSVPAAARTAPGQVATLIKAMAYGARAGSNSGIDFLVRQTSRIRLHKLSLLTPREFTGRIVAQGSARDAGVPISSSV